MASDNRAGHAAEEAGSLPLDIDNMHMLLQVEQEQIQKRTFTNWINAQLSKRKPPCAVLDLFSDLRDGSRLLDLLEVMSGQRMSREKGRGFFQERSNIETALSFLRRKSIKLVNIHIPDIIDGKPSIILGLVWTIILHFHIEELASTLSFTSRQSSIESLTSLDSNSVASSSSDPRHGSPLHTRFRISAKKALLLWVREQCHRAGCTLNVKDFKSSWRSGVVFLAILHSLRPNLVDLSKAWNRTNRQNLEEAFRIAEKELHIPRLLEPADIDIRDPDEKSIMTYVAQFLQYSKEMPVSEEEMQTHYLTTPKCLSPISLPTHFTPAVGASPLRQAHLLRHTLVRASPYHITESDSRHSAPGTSANEKAREVTGWLLQAYEELLEGWDSTEGESYAERYHVFQTFLTSFNEQRRPVMPLLTAMRRTPQLSKEQRALRIAWDSLAEKLRKYKTELDLNLPPPLDSVGHWLLRVEEVLATEIGDAQDHDQASQEARNKLDLLKTSLEEMNFQLRTVKTFHNMDEYGAILVPTDKLDELKRRFTSIRVTAKYHSIKLEYQEYRHMVLHLLGRITDKLRTWKRPCSSQEAVRVLLQDWHDTVEKEDLLSLLETNLLKLKLVASRYTSKSALAADNKQISQQVKEAETEAAAKMEDVPTARASLGRVLSAWDSYHEASSSIHAWLQQDAQSHSPSQTIEVTPEATAEWSSLQTHLNEVGVFLTEVTDPRMSRLLADELHKLNTQWADFVKRNKLAAVSQPGSSRQSPQAVQALVREAAQLMKEPVEVSSGPLRTYRKRLQFMSKRFEKVDLDDLVPSLDCTSEMLQKLRLSLPEVMHTICEAESVCEELQRSVSGLDSRLAELQLWEVETRELYCHLLEGEVRYSRGQDPSARDMISRGLQLEGQVVTEEQDLQVMVMSAQKNSPLQYLIATVMQDRVRAAVSQSQEAVGLLSSVGSRRDRSPTGDQPPPKIFVQMCTEEGSEMPDHVQAQTLQPQALPRDEPHLSYVSGDHAEPQDESQSPPDFSTHNYTELPPQVQTYSYLQGMTEAQLPPQLQPEPIQPSVFTQTKNQQQPQTKPQAQTEPRSPQRQISTRPWANKNPESQVHTASWVYNQTQSTFPASSRTSSEDQTQGYPQPQLQSAPWRHIEAESSFTASSTTKAEGPTHGYNQPWAQAQSQVPPKSLALTQLESQAQTLPQIWMQSQALVQDQTQAQSQPHCIPTARVPVLAQAPPRAYTEAYAKAQALARDRFEEAKHCLQDHILETIMAFNDKSISEEEVIKKEETLRTLDPELLEEFLRAAEGMEAFCTEAQLRDLEFFTQSVQTQWEACLSAEGSLEQAGRHLEALRELCDTLSPEDAHRLAQAQLRECERRLAAIQRQFSGDSDTPSAGLGLPTAAMESDTQQKVSVLMASSPYSPVSSEMTVGLASFEQRQPTEKLVSKQEMLNNYQASRTTLQAQLAKVQQRMWAELTPGPASLAGLHCLLQEVQNLKQETEELWADFKLQSSHCSQLKEEGPALEQDLHQLVQQWEKPKIVLEERMKSLKVALGLLDSVEGQVKHVAERLHRFIGRPRDISALRLPDDNSLQEAKELQESIQHEMDQLSSLHRDGGQALHSLYPPDRRPVTFLAKGFRQSLDQLRQRVKQCEAAIRALDRFLVSLHALDQDIGTVWTCLSDDAAIIQDCRARLAMLRQNVQGVGAKAPELDQLLRGALMVLSPASCADTVAALQRRLEEADTNLARRHKDLQREHERRALGLRRRTLKGALYEVQAAAERHGLKEPTMPAVQQRMRALTDLENLLAAYQSELQSLRDASAQLTPRVDQEGYDPMEELEIQWKDSRRAVMERQEQCRVLMDLLKKFHSCRSRLGNTLQRAEQTISEQASYMGKDNLQRLIATVHGIKEDLGALGEGVEEIRGVCRQLQCHLKKIPDCADAPYESEANALVDRWLDVSEKTDTHMDNLRVALELWDKLLLIGSEVDNWMGSKLAMFAESQPFQNEQDVITMQVDIVSQEESINHFHRKSAEIQELLQSKEPPLELQVTETQLWKKLEQVKELFSESSDVFQDLMVVRERIAERMAECQASLRAIQSSLSMLNATDELQTLNQIQVLSTQLRTQMEQADALLQEVSLMASVASPQALEALAADGVRLKESVHATQQLIGHKREQVEKGVLKVIDDECQAFDQWFQDLQLSLNEYFENPEQRRDLEASVEKLADFLAYQEVEKRLNSLKEQITRAQERLPQGRAEELHSWLEEQEEELAAFRAHCQDRHKQLETCLHALNSLQEESSHLSEWLQTKEHKSARGCELSHLQEEVLGQSGSFENLADLVESVRRQGLRGDCLLRDSNDLLNRYHGLQTKLHDQVEAENALAKEIQAFQILAESTRFWIKSLQQQAHDLSTDSERDKVQTEKRLQEVQNLLSLRAEGDARLQDLRNSGQELSEQQNLEESRRTEVLQKLHDAEQEWKAVMQSAEELHSQVEAQRTLAIENQAFQTLADGTLAWIRDLQQQMEALDRGSKGDQLEIEERLQRVQELLSLRAEGDARLQDLRSSGQELSKQWDLEETRRTEVLQILDNADQEWKAVMQSAEELRSQVEAQRTLAIENQAFQTLADGTLAWIRDLQQQMEALDRGSKGSQTEIEERLQRVQDLLGLRAEGDARLRDLRNSGLSERQDLEESRRTEVLQILHDAEQEWKAVMQSAEELRSQIEAQRTLAIEEQAFQTLADGTLAWIRDLQQQMEAQGRGSKGSQTEIEERLQRVQDFLSLRTEGDAKLRDLRNSGQKLSERQDLEESRRAEVLQILHDAEQEWKAVMQSAEELRSQVEAQRTLAKENQAFQTLADGTLAWIRDLQQQMEALDRGSKGSQAEIEERLQRVQDFLSLRIEGDGRLRDLRSSGQELSEQQDLEESRRTEILQILHDTEQEWKAVMQSAEELRSHVEAQRTLAIENQAFQTLADGTLAWIRDLQQQIEALDRGSKGSQAEIEVRLQRVQDFLSLRIEGDARLRDLRNSGLSERQDLEESRRTEVLQILHDAEQEWKAVMQSAEELRSQIEAQRTLAIEEQAFQNLVDGTLAWIRDLQQQMEALDRGSKGCQAEIEERLQRVQGLLRLRAEGNARLKELSNSGQELFERQGLEESRKSEVLQTLHDGEQEWKAVMQSAEELNSLLQGVSERLLSCLCQKQQAQTRLEQLQKQTAGVPRLFPWPGLGDRRLAAELAQSLLDCSMPLAPTLAALQAQGVELFQLTHDLSWTDPSWAELVDSIPPLVKDLEGLCQDLKEGIRVERECAQLVEQHSAAQDWLNDQVSAIGALSDSRQDLQSMVNTLKALMQTADREEKELRDLEVVKDSLWGTCSPSGQMTLAAEVGHLHELRASSVEALQERLWECEVWLRELDEQLASRVQALRGETSSLQRALQEQSEHLAYRGQLADLSQVQQHWQCLKDCEGHLEELGRQVDRLQLAVGSEGAEGELPMDVVTTVAALALEHSRLRSMLTERQADCSEESARRVTESLQALEQWVQSASTILPTESALSIQETLIDGEQLLSSLQGALSHSPFLMNLLGTDRVGRLETAGNSALKEATVQVHALTQSLQDLVKKEKSEEQKGTTLTQVSLAGEDTVSTEAEASTTDATMDLPRFLFTLPSLQETEVSSHEGKQVEPHPCEMSAADTQPMPPPRIKVQHKGPTAVSTSASQQSSATVTITDAQTLELITQERTENILSFDNQGIVITECGTAKQMSQDSYTSSPEVGMVIDGQTEHATALDHGSLSVDEKNIQAAQSDKMTGLVLDTEMLHVQTTDPWQAVNTETVHIAASGTVKTDMAARDTTKEQPVVPDISMQHSHSMDSVREDAQSSTALHQKILLDVSTLHGEATVGEQISIPRSEQELDQKILATASPIPPTERQEVEMLPHSDTEPQVMEQMIIDLELKESPKEVCTLADAQHLKIVESLDQEDEKQCKSMVQSDKNFKNNEQPTEEPATADGVISLNETRKDRIPESIQEPRVDDSVAESITEAGNELAHGPEAVLVQAQGPVAPPRRRSKEQKVQGESVVNGKTEIPKVQQPNKSLKAGDEILAEAGERLSTEGQETQEPCIESAMHKIFVKVEQLVETGPNHCFIWGEPLGTGADTLDTSDRDLEARLSRVVFTALSCQNRPAEIDAAAMVQQVEEAEACRVSAKEQLASLNLQAVSEGEGAEAMRFAETQWTEALWDAEAAVCTKDRQLQLSMQLQKLAQAARATLERLVAEFEALTLMSMESSSQRAVELKAFLQNMEQERSVLGELLQIHAQMWPYLGPPDRSVIQSQLDGLQEEWRILRRAAETSLYRLSVLNQEVSSFLLETQDLHHQIEVLEKILGPSQTTPVQWNSKRAGELLIVGADLAAASQWYLHLQHTAEALEQASPGETEKRNISLALQGVKKELDHMRDQLSAQMPCSCDATMVKIIKVMEEAFTAVKQTEKNTEAEKKVALLPQEVHRQIKALKKLQADFADKQAQLECLVEEVKELMAKLQEADIPVVLSSLKFLEDLSQSTSEKLARTLQMVESGLQVREKMSVQITDVDAWVVAHIRAEAIMEVPGDSRTVDLDHRLWQLQDTLQEADRQAAVTEALIMKSKDISSELSIDENCRLNAKLTGLQEEIKAIISHERTNHLELEELLKEKDSSQKNWTSVEKKLRQISSDLKKCGLPITKDSLMYLQPFKHMILELRCQVDQLHNCSDENRKELLCIIVELQNKIDKMCAKSSEHEKYLCYRQQIDGLKVSMEAQVLQMKDQNVNQEDQYIAGLALLIQFPLMKRLCQEAMDHLQEISPDLYPSQFSLERQKIQEALEIFSTWEMTVHNNIRMLEWEQLKALHYPTERRALLSFLEQAEKDMQQSCLVSPSEEAVTRELKKCLALQKNVEARVLMLEALEHKSEAGQKGPWQTVGDVELLKEKTLKACHLRMESLSRAREALRNCSATYRGLTGLLQDAERVVLPGLCRIGPCRDVLHIVRNALVSLNEEFQGHVEQLQALAPQQVSLFHDQAEQLHHRVLSQLLVWLSVLQAQGQLHLEALERCTEKQGVFQLKHEETLQQLTTSESRLSECISDKVTSLKQCLDQQEKLRVLVQEVESLQGRLAELREWCPHQGCSRTRAELINTTWRRWVRLQRFTHNLRARSEQRALEWRNVDQSVDRAVTVLDQLCRELPDKRGQAASLKEPQELLAHLEQYLERLDCEHRALTALELQVARLLGVPAHQEQTPPIALCQKLQMMQDQYKDLKERGMLDRRAAQMEVQERERVKEEIQGIQEWLLRTSSLLSVQEHTPNSQELQDIQGNLGSQKALLQGIMDGLQMKYSEMYTLVPTEIEAQLQEATRSLQEVEQKVGEVVEKNSPLRRLTDREAEIRGGFQSVLGLLEQQSSTASEAESMLKRVWDELDLWHSCMAALEVEVQDLLQEQPEEGQLLMGKLMETQQLHQRFAKQAEQRTSFLGKVHTSLKEHEEMIRSSNCWLIEAQSWLEAPSVYITAKCLNNHASALQSVLNDSEQVRRTLQAFMLVLQEISPVCDTAALEEQLTQADQRVAAMQQSIVGPQSELDRAATEVDAMETKMKMMEKTLDEVRSAFSIDSVATLNPEDQLRAQQVAQDTLQAMRRTITDLEMCKGNLRLPEGASETLSVFQTAKKLQLQIQGLEQELSERSATLQAAVSGAAAKQDEPVAATSAAVPGQGPVLEESEESEIEEGQIHIVHLEEDALKKSGASLRVVEESSPEQRLHWNAERVSIYEDALTGEEQTAVPGGTAELTGGVTEPCPEGGTKIMAAVLLPAAAGMEEARPEPAATGSQESLSQCLVTNAPSVTLSRSSPKAQQRCVLS